MPDVLIIRERPPHLSVVALLEAEGLPASDLTESHLEHFFFTSSDGAPSALVRLELYGESTLLRSIYLLTTTAEAYFEHRGYRRVDRAQAPASIQSTSEFASLCRASPAFMIKRL